MVFKIRACFGLRQRAFILIFVAVVILFAVRKQMGNDPSSMYSTMDNQVQNFEVETNTSRHNKVHMKNSLTVSNRMDSRDCDVHNIDPFSHDITEHMKDFGDIQCGNAHDFVLAINLNKIHVSGKDIDYIRSREIVKDDKTGYKFLDNRYLLEPRVSMPVLIKGK